MNEQEINSQADIEQQTTVGIDDKQSEERTNDKIVEKSYTDEKTGKFKPGNPGKPLGAKKKKPSIWDYLEDDEDKIKIREFINDPKFLDKVAEYILGKPKTPIIGGDEDDPVIKHSHEIKESDLDKVLEIYERNKQK